MPHPSPLIFVGYIIVYPFLYLLKMMNMGPLVNHDTEQEKLCDDIRATPGFRTHSEKKNI